MIQMSLLKSTTNPEILWAVVLAMYLFNYVQEYWTQSNLRNDQTWHWFGFATVADNDPLCDILHEFDVFGSHLALGGIPVVPGTRVSVEG